MGCEIGDCIAQSVGRETEAPIDVVVRSGLRHSISANCERGPESDAKEQRAVRSRKRGAARPAQTAVERQNQCRRADVRSCPLPNRPSNKVADGKLITRHIQHDGSLRIEKPTVGKPYRKAPLLNQDSTELSQAPWTRVHRQRLSSQTNDRFQSIKTGSFRRPGGGPVYFRSCGEPVFGSLGYERR